VRALKHGLYARVVTPREAARYRLEQLIPGSPAVLDAYVSGDTEKTDGLAVRAMAEKVMLRLLLAGEILQHGPTASTPMIDRNGNQIGERTTVNPGLKHLRWLDEHLGFTVSDLLLSRKGQLESRRLAATQERLEERRIRLAEFATRDGYLLLHRPRTGTKRGQGGRRGVAVCLNLCAKSLRS